MKFTCQQKSVSGSTWIVELDNGKKLAKFFNRVDVGSKYVAESDDQMRREGYTSAKWEHVTEEDVKDHYEKWSSGYFDDKPWLLVGGKNPERWQEFEMRYNPNFRKTELVML